MLTEREKHGIAELLSRMGSLDLVSLAQTVTSRLLAPSTDSEAIEAIILHTDKATDLLKRKKVKKELLFKYLHAKRVPIESVSDKGTHVSRVLEVWESLETWDRSHQDWEMDSDNSLEGPPPAPVPSRNASHTSLCSLDLTRDSGLPNLGRLDFALQNSIAQGAGHLESPLSNDMGIRQVFGSAGLDGLGEAGGVLGQQAQLSQSQCQDMANSFARWYYQLLNSCVDTEETDWGPRHFWPDASARVEMISRVGESEVAEVHRNASEVCTMLVQVFRRHKLKCNPNLCEEGVKGLLDPHGLVLVLACGTLHNQLTVCGVFEQVFCLVRDPNSDNNWKIKRTEARLLGGSVNGQHRIMDSPLLALANS